MLPTSCQWCSLNPLIGPPAGGSFRQCEPCCYHQNRGSGRGLQRDMLLMVLALSTGKALQLPLGTCRQKLPLSLQTLTSHPARAARHAADGARAGPCEAAGDGGVGPASARARAPRGNRRSARRAGWRAGGGPRQQARVPQAGAAVRPPAWAIKRATLHGITRPFSMVTMDTSLALYMYAMA